VANKMTRNLSSAAMLLRGRPRWYADLFAAAVTAAVKDTEPTEHEQ
jgi:hypothetical protein